MKTPEQLEAEGVALIDVPIDPVWRPDDSTSEYWRRIKAYLPLRAPRFRVGEWAYNHCAGENQRVLSVHWDDSAARFGCGFAQWRYNLPGLGSPDITGPLEGAPRVEYEQTAAGSHCWQRVAPY